MLAWRRVFAAFAMVSLFAGSAFAFPYDPKPSAIDTTGGYGTGTAAFSGFTGDWTNTLRSLTRQNLLVLEYMNQQFLKEGGGPGGKKDLKIWTTPSFSDPVKTKNDKDSWNHLLANPGSAVPAGVGKSMLTTHDELVRCIEEMPRTNLTVEYLGEIPRGFPFPMLVFSTSKDRSPAGLKKTGKPLVWIQGNVHGGEWSGGEAALAMAQQLAIGTHDKLLEKINVIVIPRINADGAKRPIRESYNTQALQWTATPEPRDLNRDHMLLDHPVTRAMKKMLAAYEPHFSVDLHERGNTAISSGTGMNTVQGRFGRVVDNDAGDLGTAGATSMQLPRDFLALRYNELDPVLAKTAEEVGIWMGLYREGPCTYAQGNQNSYANDWTVAWNSTTWNPNHPDNVPEFNGLTKGPYSADVSSYQTAASTNGLITSNTFDPDAPYFIINEALFNPRNARNNNAMAGAVSQLYENKSGPTNVGNRGMFERRVAASYVAILATMTDAANRADFWMETLSKMRAQWIEKGKTVSKDDMVTILPLPPKPSFWGQPNPAVGYKGHDLPWMVVDITDANPSGNAAVTGADLDNVIAYDSTKAMKYVGPGLGRNGTKNNAYEVVTDGSGTKEYQMFKFVYNWQGPALRERMRPYAYILEGPYASEAATRMALNGVEVKRLAKDTEIEVEAHKYNQTVYIDNSSSDHTGWRNRDVSFYPAKKLFKKDDTYVVYLSQVRTHQITTYFEPDMPWSAIPCVYLPYMSVDMGGSGSGYLHAGLTGMEMPSYRYLKEVDLPTYDMNMALPLINRGAVARFFDFPTPEYTKGIADTINKSSIRVYNYDIQVHARTDAFVGGKFDITLPTSADTKEYMIRKRDGTYEQLAPHADLLGFNVATVDVAAHGTDPFTVDMAPNNRPVIGEGVRSLVHQLPPNDDLIGVQLIEVLKDPAPEPEPKKKSSSRRWSCGG